MITNKVAFIMYHSFHFSTPNYQQNIMIYSFKLQTNGSFSFQNYRTRPIYFYSVLKEMATQGNIYLWMILFSANLKSLFIKEEKVANNDFRNRVL